jgi:uncharacterized protein YjbI with pentapeptide repeats
LREANFEGADLREADLREADFEGANLSGACVVGVRWSNAQPPTGWELDGDGETLKRATS